MGAGRWARGTHTAAGAGGIPQLTSFRVRMLSWMGLGKPTTVLVSLKEGKSQAESRAEHPGVGQRPPRDKAMEQPAKAFPAAMQRQKQPPDWPLPQATPSGSTGLALNPPAQRVADEFAAAGFQEHLNVLLPATKRKGKSHIFLHIWKMPSHAQGKRYSPGTGKSLVVRRRVPSQPHKKTAITVTTPSQTPSLHSC